MKGVLKMIKDYIFSCFLVLLLILSMIPIATLLISLHLSFFFLILSIWVVGCLYGFITIYIIKFTTDRNWL